VFNCTAEGTVLVSIVEPSNRVAFPFTVALSRRKAPFAITVPMAGDAALARPR
jgi:hypothetical protein